MDKPRDDANYPTSTGNAPDLFGEKAGQSQSAAEQGQTPGGMNPFQSGSAFASTAGLTANLSVQGGTARDASAAGDPTFATEVQNNAAEVVADDAGSVTQAPDDGDNVNSDPSEPNAVDAVTYEGKKVFSPHELNQAGEDKEYFHPDKDHKFDAPKDANDHALTPDIEVKPDNTVGRVG
ncbi:hypothetical protein ABI_13790 [Asticcacaulis biprosthecium C19]|uniref:Uncharacterized protein n=1 Tax=Asticcacaulis biprosthecium C19 TaxID=715226 RepID=F4QIF1_9CAUL|nr:hypothetical protein [Asticcacaulis biprosthecium]EGF92940.1 hypothetical protein ABI_13790 [Asticcacaulis biprosthecium C19]